MQSEAELIRACLTFDNAAQKALYERYIGKMNAVCRRYVPNEEERKDIVQEGFIKVFQNIEKYRSDGPLEAWIRRIIVNTTLSYLRKHKPNDSEKTVDINQYQESHTLVDQEEEDNDSIYNADFSKETLMGAIDSLPEKYRVVFNLHCIDDYSHKIIAELLSISEEGSRTRLKRAKEMLKTYLIQLHKVQIK